MFYLIKVFEKNTDNFLQQIKRIVLKEKFQGINPNKKKSGSCVTDLRFKLL